MVNTTEKVIVGICGVITGILVVRKKLKGLKKKEILKNNWKQIKMNKKEV